MANVSAPKHTVWTGDYDDDANEHAPRSLVVRQSSNFVAPLPPAPIVAQPVNQVQPFDMAGMPIMHTSEAVDQSDELTRAKGFTLRTAPLALALGASVAGVVWLAAGGVWAVVSLFAVFSVVWSVAFVVHLNRTPAGIAWHQSTSMWRIVEREAEYRRRVDWHERTKQR
jgi:hypothetical protein